MSDTLTPTDRAWWDAGDRCVGWPEDLKDEIHAAVLEGYMLGLAYTTQENP